jgi:hypothetical protein
MRSQDASEEGVAARMVIQSAETPFHVVFQLALYANIIIEMRRTPSKLEFHGRVRGMGSLEIVLVMAERPESLFENSHA